MWYLIEKYDTERKFNAESIEDRVSMQQWMFFQNCDQGYVSSIPFRATCLTQKYLH